jgi:putative toxin-antitoxin system antitoxin component (TIGR02293 family)
VKEVKIYSSSNEHTSFLNEPLNAYYTTYHPTMNAIENMKFSDFLDNKMQVIRTIDRGISYDLYAAIATLLPFTDSQWADLLGISAKSLTRYKTEDEHLFKSLQSEKILQVAEVMLKGHEVLESASSFNRWVMAPSVVLGGMSPFKLMRSSYGKELVMDELNRIEHGIFV